MLQRIQSLYLLLSAICIAFMLKFPFANFGDQVIFDAWGVTNESNLVLHQLFDFPAYSIIGAVLILSLVLIFLFKNRKLQITLCRLNYLLILGLIVLLYMNIDKLKEGLQMENTFEVGLYLPVVALAFNFLANRAIKKDEDLVRSLDRLR